LKSNKISKNSPKKTLGGARCIPAHVKDSHKLGGFLSPVFEKVFHSTLCIMPCFFYAELKFWKRVVIIVASFKNTIAHFFAGIGPIRLVMIIFRNIRKNTPLATNSMLN
jgi:hypothetical protein